MRFFQYPVIRISLYINIQIYNNYPNGFWTLAMVFGIRIRSLIWSTSFLSCTVPINNRAVDYSPKLSTILQEMSLLTRLVWACEYSSERVRQILCHNIKIFTVKQNKTRACSSPLVVLQR